MTESRGETGRDRFNLFGGGGNDNGTGRDGKMKTKKLAGRDSGCILFQRGGTVKTDLHDGTGRQIFFPSAGRDGKCFFPRRDGTLNMFFL